MNTNTPAAKRQVVIWGRFSSDQQKDGDSQDRQDRVNAKAVERFNLDPIAKHFDPGTSVKSGVTPLFKRMVSSLPPGVGIVAENLDRINRDHPWRQKAYIMDLIDAGHFIITSGDNVEYNTTTVQDFSVIAVGDLKTNVSNSENEKRTGRVREEKLKAIDAARHGQPAPLGAWLPRYVKFNFETRQYDYDENIIAAIHTMFEMYSNGTGVNLICRKLNNDKVPTFLKREIGKWTRSSIMEIMRYRGVIGEFNLKGETISANAWKPAISPELFYTVQAMLDANKVRHGNLTSERVNNVFRGLLKCTCGCAMKVYKHKYIQCAGHREGKEVTRNQCKNMVQFPAIEYVLAAWLIPTAKELLMGKDESVTTIMSLAAKKTSIQVKLDTMLDMVMNGVAVNEAKERIAKLEIERNTVENEITKLKASTESKAGMPETFKQLESIIDGIKENQVTRKRVADLMPQIVQKVIADISNKERPKFTVTLTDGKEIVWEYKPELYVKMINLKKMNTKSTPLAVFQQVK
jgi:DNA invertase Pin-like site-specific DNA recombinase